MKKLWFALLFFAGGFVAHEVRNPVNCQCITTTRQPALLRKRGRRDRPMR